jgi:alpha-D-ribose 1-methylphosphonate 5-triphosphate diphosphatase
MTVPESDYSDGDYSTSECSGSEYLIANVRAVTPDAIIDRAVITVVDGRIAAVDHDNRVPDGAIDGHGLLALPGLIDSHSDGLEIEISPRKTTRFPLDFALTSFEGRVRAAGVTTVFHGLGYQEKPRSGRSVELAGQICQAVRGRRTDGTASIRHELLYRFEARDPVAIEPMLADVRQSQEAGLINALVSFEDHTPGQGQYRNPEQFYSWVDPAETGGLSVEDYVAKLMADAEELRPYREKNLARLAALARSGEIRMVAHDLDSPEAVEAAAEAGSSIAEFPVTVEAATAAREAGMFIVTGAPNVMRGLSASGNVSARELIEAGLCDVVASDYMPSALLASALTLVDQGLCDLPTAVALITAGPADMVGLDDRGRLEEGAVADLVLVDDREAHPRVVGTRLAADRPERTVL